MSAQHTPGPWVVGKNIIGSRDEYGFNRHIVSMEWKDEQGAADSRLIAAAPDLLDALINLLATHEGEGGTRYHAGDIARAAIKKATQS